ncbi:probable ATP-dependent RNA helicase DDX60 [Hippopotamus amphibius kiboko]|uniref:probable ATP-dependent RNA helicase DDX60 n=1 Tax=Hippopotamus amphibius kiboko TaxID=575201 RepID=UPI002599E4EE|nr:probable ATP-dependent RNA helicase DDX60 [Hippopotamus amphibius kiboko]
MNCPNITCVLAVILVESEQQKEEGKESKPNTGDVAGAERALSGPCWSSSGLCPRSAQGLPEHPIPSCASCWLLGVRRKLQTTGLFLWIMASAPTVSSEKLSPSNSDSESESDTESDSSEGSETSDSLSSFDRSEEEDHLSSEDITEESAFGKIPCEFEINEETLANVEATDVSSCDLERSELTECKEVLRKLSMLIWKTLSKSKMVSLLKDFVESEFFLIDGDSLFITCVSNVNFKKGQTLHFFYIVEQFLHDFIQKEAKFVIVFFKDAENMYFKYSEHLVLRTMLIQHLQHNTDVTIHTEFSNCLSPEWEIFLKEYYPHFLIVSEMGITFHQAHFLNIFIIHTLQKKIDIVQTLGIESDVLRIHGYYASSCYLHKQFFEMDLTKTPTLSEAVDLCRMHCLSVTLLRQLPLFQRAKSRLITCVWDRALSPFRGMLKKCAFFILKQLESRNNWHVNFAGLPDLTDDLLWKNIAYYYEIEHSRGLTLGLGDTLMREYLKLWDMVLTLSGSGMISDDPAVTSLSKKREFDELTHWHSSKPLCDDFERARCNSDENQKRQLAKLEKREEERWSNLSLFIEKEIQENPDSGIKRLEDFLQKCPVKSIKFTAEMVGLDACFKLWMEHCVKPEAESKDISIVTNMMKRIHSICEKYSELLQKTHQQKLAKYLKYIGFDNLAHSLRPQESGTEKDISKYSVHMGAARFQLTYMGPYLFREERSDPDPRVHHFIPDTWQRELLDIVDKNESAVIVAPTSSGKTYASYYCMERVLREGDEGVVVYVAPTKALVNQVVGTICSLFTKALPKGLVVCGVFTRDYRHDTLNCQILVTVPQCLEILLLSPHSQKWVKRMRYVIFDEVHCLGGEIGAEVWEHLLAMIRCPFLALSATISNPEHLTEWLVLIKRYWQHVESTVDNSGSSQNALKDSKKQQRKTAEKPSYKVRLVWYKERYNDLEKYVCSLKDNDFLIEHYHPCAALTVKHIKKYGIPVDLGFSPRESVLLYDAMAHIWPEWPRVQELEPEEFSCFKNKVVIMRADAKKYEEELKKEIIRWIQLDPSKSCFLLLHTESLWDERAETSSRCRCKGKETGRTRRGMLDPVPPGTRADCTPLSAQQVQVPWDSGARIQRVILWAAEIKEIKKNLRKRSEVPPECTYAERSAVDAQTLMKILRRLKGTRRGYKLYSLLRRGIGYHHGSMGIRQRQVVEMLFRLKHLKVVTATSTLALGINMPCKSVVFTEDSVFLDALNFRQMSGRAGRRGEDLTGSVFFYNIPVPKIERLLKSNVPKLKGQFPLTLSLVLRLMLLVAKADDKEDAKAKALSVLQHSLMSFKQPNIRRMLKFYFIYSLQFLVTEGFLDQDCTPIGYSGLVTHLHYHEPSNFVLVSLLVKGLFHKLCVPTNIKGQKTFSEEVMETLVVVLAHLFGRNYLPPCAGDFKKRFSHSVVTLKDLPKDFAAVVEEHNDRIQKNFASFLLTISKLADMRKEYQLPLSEIDFSGKECADSELVCHLMPGVESRTAVSPFACLSNITDQDLFDVNVVKDAMLRTIDVDAKNLPLLFLNKYDKSGRKYPLNGYVLNFHKHGSLSALTEDNWLNMGDAFNLIRDFALVTQAIRISLSELCDDKNDNVVLAFTQLSEAFNRKLGPKERP